MIVVDVLVAYTVKRKLRWLGIKSLLLCMRSIQVIRAFLYSLFDNRWRLSIKQSCLMHTVLGLSTAVLRAFQIVPFGSSDRLTRFPGPATFLRAKPIKI